MKLINKSGWDTKDLRKLCREAIKRSGAENHTKIIVKTRKGMGSHNIRGLAYVGHPYIEMKVPPVMERRYAFSNTGNRQVVEEKPAEFDSVDFAKVLTHEIDHNLGLRHKDMVSCSALDCEWAKDYIVKPKEKRPTPPKQDIRKARYEAVLAKVKSWEAKKKRAETALKKYKQKQKYYERAS